MYTTTTKVYNKIGVTSTDVSTTIMDEFIMVVLTSVLVTPILL